MKRTECILFCLLMVGASLTAQVSKMEEDYNQLEERYELREKNLAKDLKQYLVLYPYTTYADEIHFMQGVLLVERAYYKQALKELERTDYKTLARPHQVEYQFYRGYAHLMQQDYAKAQIYFGNLKKKESQFSLKARYYYAFCQYKLGSYDKALPALLELENTAEYGMTVPYYIVQIYYYQHNYDEVEQRAEALLSKETEGENAGELHRILGEIYYQKGDYAQAISHLKQYEAMFTAQKKELIRNDIYLLGMATYKTADYESAVKYLKQVKAENDSISESTCLQLGHAYRQLGQTEQAKLWYQAAMQYNLNKTAREEAMYNYALSTYESSTALGESVNAFLAFLKEYPDSKYENQVFELMSDALRRSKNYQAALSALDSIPNPNRKMCETKQYLRYQLGTDAFIQGKMAQADEWLTAVIDDKQYGEQYRQEAYYWRAETAYRSKNYQECRNDLNRFFNCAGVKKSPNYAAAFYLNAYACFNMSEYPQAKREMQQYLGMIRPTDKTYADALNRLGDCEFNARQFEAAIQYYARVAQMNTTGSDYAMFQRGYAQGLLRRYGEKINSMQELLKRYPRSDYADDGLYEIARAQIEKDDEAAAIGAYERLLDQYPKSPLARKASVERAMLYRNLHQNENAIAAYKQTIERYPGTEEAYTALEGLEAVSIEENKVNDYLAYTKNLGKLNMSVSLKEDSLRYTAHYYAAIHAYEQKNYDAALAEYKALVEITGNPYMEEACMRAAEISYDKKDYKTALNYFRKMQSAASSHELSNVAKLGVLRCCYNLNRQQETIEIATQILNDELIGDAVREEALYNRAKAYVATGQYGMAVVDLDKISKEVRTASGAEAKYLTAECYYNLGALDKAEEEIMAFMQMETQQQYWLAKALILLSDINLSRGEDFQARQYLITLQNNYRGQDDILSIVAEKMKILDSLHQQVETEETEEEV